MTEIPYGLNHDHSIFFLANKLKEFTIGDLYLEVNSFSGDRYNGLPFEGTMMQSWDLSSIIDSVRNLIRNGFVGFKSAANKYDYENTSGKTLIDINFQMMEMTYVISRDYKTLCFEIVHKRSRDDMAIIRSCLNEACLFPRNAQMNDLFRHDNWIRCPSRFRTKDGPFDLKRRVCYGTVEDLILRLPYYQYIKKRVLDLSRNDFDVREAERLLANSNVRKWAKNNFLFCVEEFRKTSELPYCNELYGNKLAQIHFVMVMLKEAFGAVGIEYWDDSVDISDILYWKLSGEVNEQ